MVSLVTQVALELLMGVSRRGKRKQREWKGRRDKSDARVARGDAAGGAAPVPP